MKQQTQHLRPYMYGMTFTKYWGGLQDSQFPLQETKVRLSEMLEMQPGHSDTITPKQSTFLTFVLHSVSYPAFWLQQ
jgi:hypothetical protein